MISVRTAVAVVVLSLVGLSAGAAAQQSTPVESCTKTLGSALARRIVKHCLDVGSGVTRPPCNAVNSCETIMEFSAQMCENLGKQAPVSCREDPSMLKLTSSGRVDRLLETVTVEEREAGRAREHVRALRAKVEPLAAQRKAVAAGLKTAKTEFANRSRLARAAYDKHKAAIKKPGAVGLEESRKAVFAELEAVTRRGQALAKDTAALAELEGQLTKWLGDVDVLRAGIVIAAKDAKEVKTLIDLLTAELGRAATKEKTEAALKEKLAVKDKPQATSRDAETAKARSLAAISAVDKAKAASVQAGLSSKALQVLQTEAVREAQTLRTLAAVSSASARSQALAAAQKTALETTKAQNALADIDRLTKAAAARRRPDAPSASKYKCDLEQVDFRNFSYPSAYVGGGGTQRFKNGSPADVPAAEREFSPQISGVKFFDLDGNGKKEAVVFLEGPPGAHTGPNNELRFMQLDDQCGIQQLFALAGGIYEGEMKGKAYFYSDTLFETPEGMHGNFAVGTERVELRYVNGEMQEVGRKPEW